MQCCYYSFNMLIPCPNPGVSPSIEECLQSLRLYDFLWQQDLHSSYQLFLRSQPGLGQCSSHVHNFMELESKIEAIPTIFSVGPLQLSAKPVKNSFQALAVSWKVEFTQFIHQQAKVCMCVRNSSWFIGRGTAVKVSTVTLGGSTNLKGGRGKVK